MKMLISDDNNGITNVTQGTYGSGTSNMMTVKISLSYLIKQKWYLDYMSKMFNDAIQAEHIEYDQCAYGL